MSPRRSARSVVAMLALAATTAFADPALLSAERMWSLQRLGAPAISADGRLAVLPVTRYEVGSDKALTDLWLFDLKDGSSRQLTSDPGPDSQPVFSPNGALIAFVSQRTDDEAPQLYVIAVDGGEARRLTNLPTGAELPKWFPDGEHIAFASMVWNDLVRWEDQRRRLKERADSQVSAHVFDSAPIAYWDHLLDERQRHLYSLDALHGGEPQAITRGSGYALPRTEADAFSYDISPDGLEIALIADVGGVTHNLDVVTLPACGCKPARDLTRGNLADDNAPRYSPDGRYLAFSQQRIVGFYADRARLMLYARKGSQLRTLTEGWDRSVSNAVWRSDSSGLVASVDDAATLRLYRFALNGAAPVALSRTPSFSAATLGRGAMVALRQSFSEPPTLVRLAENGAVTALSHFNDATLAGTSLGKVASVNYKGGAGADIQMWVIYPPGFDAAKKYPVYMLLHGGPHNGVIDGTQWRWNAQVFASWGYIVTWHNFHGSSGFGQAFADSINPDQATLPYEDTIAAANWLTAQPYVDASRMVAGGGSFGGYLAAILLGREHPFKALIAHATPYDLYAQTAADYGAEKPRFGYFWEKPEEFARISPHSSAENFRTPTLVIHGQQDKRVPADQGIELFNILQSRGVPSRLVFFPDETHWVQKPQNSLFWYSTVHDWLATYAPPGAH